MNSFSGYFTFSPPLRKEDNEIITNLSPGTSGETPWGFLKWKASPSGERFESIGKGYIGTDMAWFEYIIKEILIPKGYALNGTVESEAGSKIIITNNHIGFKN